MDSIQILLWISERSSGGPWSITIHVVRGLQGAVTTLQCSRPSLSLAGQKEKNVTFNKKISTECFLILEYWYKYPPLPKDRSCFHDDFCPYYEFYFAVSFHGWQFLIEYQAMWVLLWWIMAIFVFLYILLRFVLRRIKLVEIVWAFQTLLLRLFTWD